MFTFYVSRIHIPYFVYDIHYYSGGVGVYVHGIVMFHFHISFPKKSVIFHTTLSEKRTQKLEQQTEALNDDIKTVCGRESLRDFVLQ
jgi:hypothetical protein